METSYELVSRQFNSLIEVGATCSSNIIGPNEVMTLSLDALHKMHGAGSACSKRNSAYESIQYNGHSNLDTILNHQEHRWRRQIWDKAFSTKCQLHQVHHFSFAVLRSLYIFSSRGIRALRSRSSIRMVREIGNSPGPAHQHLTIFYPNTV